MNLLKLSCLITSLIDRYTKDGIPIAIEVTPAALEGLPNTFQFLISVNISDTIMLSDEHRVVQYSKADRLKGDGPERVIESIEDLLKRF